MSCSFFFDKAGPNITQEQGSMRNSKFVYLTVAIIMLTLSGYVPKPILAIYHKEKR